MPRMKKSSEIISAIRRVVRLRFKDPRILRCMFLSVMLAVATAGPMGKMQQSASLLDRPSYQRILSSFVKQMNARR